MSGKAKFRLFLLVAIALVCGYVVFLFFKERDPHPPMVAAERAYQDAQAYEKQGAHKEAAASYDQACLLLEHAHKRLNGPHGLDMEPATELAGRVYYLKSKALRDKHYALAAAAGKPLAETTDSVTGERYRNILAIPDVKDRDEAAGSLRGAAIHFLKKDYDVQLDVLRMTLMAPTIPWEQVDGYSRAILEIKGDDARAKYLLAKYNFEQPDPATHRPTNPERRSSDRVKTALRYIDEVRDDPKFPVWRTEYLRASIHYWLMKTYAKNREREYNEQLDILDRLLLDDTNGAVVRIRETENFDRLSAWDVEGILGLQTLAADVALDAIRRRKLDPRTLARVYDDTLAFCQSRWQANDPSFSRQALIATLLNVMSEGQTILALQHSRGWQAGLSALRSVLQEEFRAGRCDPYRVAQFAELLMRESQLEARRGGDAKQAADLRAEARKWLDDGLRFGREHGFTNLQMTPFNVLAANIAYFNHDPREAAAPFLAALQESRIPQAQATALVIDGAYDERDGRLEKAREKLEQAIKVSAGDEDVRAHASLANIYMAMSRPDNALVSLMHLQSIYARYNDLTLQEKEWLAVFLRSPQDYYALTVIASLDSARQTLAQYQARNPRAKVPATLVKEQESRARAILDRELASAVTPAGFLARTAWISYLTTVNRIAEAETELAAMQRTFPDRVELLKIKAELIERAAASSGDPGKIKTVPVEVDALIQNFIKMYPSNQSAKLYYATWLAQTRRTEQAVQYLKETIDTTTLTPELRRVAAAVLLSLNSDASASTIARHLPRNPQVDKALFGLTVNNAQKQRDEVRGVLSRHESVGYTRIMKAEDSYLAGRFSESAEEFASALEFTRMKPLAEQGFLRAMIAFANQRQPRDRLDAPLDLIRKITAAYPTEPCVLLAYAYVFLKRDEIGAPSDDWEQRGRNMASALNAWELNLERSGRADPVAVALTRAEFWFLANRIDIALSFAQRALSHDPRNVAALGVSAGMILDDPAQADNPRLREYLDELKRLAPDSVASLRLFGRAAEQNGQWLAAADFYEQILAKSPKDRLAYGRLVIDYDQAGEHGRALKAARDWRSKLPDDSGAAAAEARMYARTGDLAQARRVAGDFVDRVEVLATRHIEKLVEPELKTRFIEEARAVASLEMARGLYLGGAYAEAEDRIQQLPKMFLNLDPPQQLLSEIHMKRKEWAKAEAILEAMVQRNPNNFVAVNNLAFVLANHQNKPSRAREVILASLKTGPRSFASRGPERLPPEFLNTVGMVYAKLDNPEFGREVLDFFRAATQRYPKDPRVELYLGYGFELIGENKQAREYYERAMRDAGHPALSHDQRRVLLSDASAFLARVQSKLNRPE